MRLDSKPEKISKRGSQNVLRFILYVNAENFIIKLNFFFPRFIIIFTPQKIVSIEPTTRLVPTTQFAELYVKYVHALNV